MIPGLGRSSGESNGKALHYSCLENPMDRGACQAAVYAFTKSKTRLSNYYFHCKIKSLIKNKEKKMYRAWRQGYPKLVDSVWLQRGETMQNSEWGRWAGQSTWITKRIVLLSVGGKESFLQRGVLPCSV